MALTKAYNRINWENEPSIKSPLNETNMNLMDMGINEVDNRIITLDTTKQDKGDTAQWIKNVEFNESTGEFTFTRVNNTTFKINTKLEKLAVNFEFDYQAQELEITLDDGTKQYVDMSALLSQYDFIDSNTIKVLLTGSGAQEQVSLEVIDGSITDSKIESHYLAQIQAATQEGLDNAKLAKSWAIGETSFRVDEATNNSKYWAQIAENYAGVASGTAINYRGDYNSAISYNQLDSVYYNGSTWVSKVNSNTTTPAEGSNWRYLAKGIDVPLQFMAQSQYDALPASKNTDDMLYFVN